MNGDFDFLKGNIETIILNSLNSRDKYGYEIAKDIKERTENKYEIKQPTLYSYLKRLEDDGLIGSYWGDSSNGGRRRYYKLTELGKAKCQAFVAEWNYHKEVISSLVQDATTDSTVVSQEDVTPILGRKTTKKRQPKIIDTTTDEQDEIARRLQALTTGTSEQESEQILATTPQECQAEQPVNKSVQQPTQQKPPVSEHINPSKMEQQSFLFDEPQPKAEPQTDKPKQTSNITPPRPTVTEDKSRFETNQDDAEEFLQNFDALARDASTHISPENANGENYQHVLMGVLGEQLDGIQQLEQTEHTVAKTFYNENPQQLEEVADTLAKDGIRIRIYNHATAVYKPKTLMPFAEVLCKTSWFTYLVALLYFGIFAVTSIPTSNWLQFVICAGALLIAPFVFTIWAIFNTKRREKPIFDFSKVFVATLILCLALALIIVGISVVNPKVEFNNYATLCARLFVPLGFAILPPFAVLFFNSIYKKY